jgi:membrane dipeptidase
LTAKLVYQHIRRPTLSDLLVSTLERRDFLALCALATARFAAPMINRGRFRVFSSTTTEYSERAIRLVRESLVIDMLSPFKISPSQSTKWLTHPESFTTADLQRFRDSGINVFHPAIGMGGPNANHDVLLFFALWNGFIAHHDDALLRVDSPEVLARVKQSGKIGVILGLQNSEQFARVDDVDSFFAVGQRVSQLTYNARNMIGNGSTERRDDGISDFGVTVIDRMNKVGMAVDVSHCGDRTSLDAFEVSKKPVLVTHSNVRALNPGHPRCKPDEVIRAVGKAGSVMGITGVRNFVKGAEPTTIEDVLNQFDYVKKLIGPEHLGVGSDIDLDGYDDMPPEEYKRLKAGYKGSYAFRDKIDIEGLDHPKRMYDLTEGLIRRKYSDAEISGILGGNFQRVLNVAWVPLPSTG